jgi:hypothetical protein
VADVISAAIASEVKANRTAIKTGLAADER